MLTQHHEPALWEGGCPQCTAQYRTDPEVYLMLVFMPGNGRSIDWNLRERFAVIHRDHMWWEEID